jgi:hypothetical protein
MVGCQFNYSFGEDFVFAKKRRHGGKEERYSDLLIDLELEEPEEIDMAVRSASGDQGNQQTCRQGRSCHGIQRRRTLCRNSSGGIGYQSHQFSEARRRPNNCR